MHKLCGDLIYGIKVSDIFVATDQQQVVRRVSQRAQSITQVVIDQVHLVFGGDFVTGNSSVATAAE